jgi:ABC-type polysaccharide/polyol phosphate transport system ATPase subunit
MNMPIASDQQPAVKLEDISVQYRVPRERLSGIKEYAVRWMQRRVSYEKFWALQEVSFDVRRGESFGVIGRNGSGKSTLLKVISRVLHPTRGRIVTRGKVAPLLELGGGFHPELTGRENVYLNASLLGYPRNLVDKLFPSIVDFAELGEFIDAPIRTYSTGMVARLGFAVATCVRPQILLLDEVLSVGDTAFQKKCLERMYDFQEQGTTILLVTHSMPIVEAFCERALWLNQGHVAAIGSASEVASRYLEMSRTPEEVATLPSAPQPTSVRPILLAEPVDAAEGQYVTLPGAERIYPAEPALNIRHGTVSVWLKFNSQEPQRTAILFHSDDSRYVLHSNIDNSDPARPIRQVVARAGGNRRALDPFKGQANFPEVVARLDPTGPGGLGFPYDKWHLVAMTWEGYPEGRVCLYLNGVLAGETTYDRRHDNHSRLPVQLAVGIRPPEWTGELVQREDGTIVDLRPQATMSVLESGQQMRDMRLYPYALSLEEMRQIPGL